MRKVIFWDRSYVIIRDDQEADVATAMARDKPFWLHHSTGRDFIKPNSIGRITKARYGEYQPDPKVLKLEAGSTQLSDEEREKARQRLEEIKATAPWYNRRKK